MSVITRKGLSIGISRVNENVFVELRAIGKLTHEDYETMTPMLEEALSEVRHPTIDALVDIRELEGWEARAAWDDFKLGMKHRKEWNRIAVVGNKPWGKVATKVGGWFTSGGAEYFEDVDAAVAWLDSED